MGPWNKLPTEIIIKIVKELGSPKDISQLQLTCKALATFAKLQLYRSITILTGSQPRAFIKSITANPSLGLLVEKVAISDALYPNLIRSHMSIICFCTIIKHCPNVRQLLNTNGFSKKAWKLLVKVLKKREVEASTLNRSPKIVYKIKWL
jgi:hypothetical protein